MDKTLSEKINILKAFGIIVVIAGHLGLWNNTLFPPYSFHVVLFFFISGMLFKNQHVNNAKNYIKRRIKSLIIPYYLYFLFYIFITFIYFKFSGTFLGLELNIKNIFLTPFINGQQLDLYSPAWFVPQLFITLIVFLLIEKVLNKHYKAKNIFYFILCLSSLVLAKFNNAESSLILLVSIRTMFSLFFVYIGNLYINKLRFKKNIFSPKSLIFVLILQTIIFLFAKYNDIDLGYELAWGYFNDLMFLPILTSLTGIWFIMYIVQILFKYIKDTRIISLIGKNTYHILANHLFSFFILTQILNKVFKIPITKSGVEIYEYCNIEHTFPLYIIFSILLSLFFAAIFKAIKKRLFNFIVREL